MARTVKYSVIPRINPRDRESEPKFYAQARMSGEVSLREMCDRIQQSCTVTKADMNLGDKEKQPEINPLNMPG